MRLDLVLCFTIVAIVGSACSWPQNSFAHASPSSAPSSPYFDPTPHVLTSNYGPGIGGVMACSGSALIFTDGPLQTLYVTDISKFSPRELLKVNDKISSVSFFGSWASVVTFRQAGDQISPLADWAVYGINTSTGQTIQLAVGVGGTELSELPQAAAGDGFIVWDELMSAGRKVLWRYDLQSGGKTQLSLPSGMYPVSPVASGSRLLFSDNSQDPNRSSESWTNRAGEPILLNVPTGQISHLAPGSVVFNALLSQARAVWFIATPDNSYVIEQVTMPTVVRSMITHTDAYSRLLANDRITIWLAPPRGAVTARLGTRTAVINPELSYSPGGLALCGSELYYAGDNFSLKDAHIG